jgi:hypothetical protein
VAAEADAGVTGSVVHHLARDHQNTDLLPQVATKCGRIPPIGQADEPHRAGDGPLPAEAAARPCNGIVELLDRAAEVRQVSGQDGFPLGKERIQVFESDREASGQAGGQARQRRQRRSPNDVIENHSEYPLFRCHIGAGCCKLIANKSSYLLTGSYQ